MSSERFLPEPPDSPNYPVALTAEKLLAIVIDSGSALGSPDVIAQLPNLPFVVAQACLALK